MQKTIGALESRTRGKQRLFRMIGQDKFFSSILADKNQDYSRTSLMCAKRAARIG
jgi:hypothetical protein